MCDGGDISWIGKDLITKRGARMIQVSNVRKNLSLDVHLHRGSWLKVSGMYAAGLNDIFMSSSLMKVFFEISDLFIFERT